MDVNQTKTNLKRVFDEYLTEVDGHKKACIGYDDKIANLIAAKRDFVADFEKNKETVTQICEFYDTLCTVLSSDKALILWDDDDINNKLLFGVIDSIKGKSSKSSIQTTVDTVIRAMGSELCVILSQHISMKECVLTALYRSEDFEDDKEDKNIFFADVISIVNQDESSHTYGLDCVIPKITKLDTRAAEENEDRDDHQYITKTFGSVKYISFKVTARCFSIKKI
jgi:hypothetical protein